MSPPAPASTRMFYWLFHLARQRMLADAMQKPTWAKRLDAVNFTIIGIVMTVVVWETISRLLDR